MLGMELCRSKYKNTCQVEHLRTKNNSGTRNKACPDKHIMGNHWINRCIALGKGITRIPSSLSLSNISWWLQKYHIIARILSATVMNSLASTDRPPNALAVMVGTVQRNLNTLPAGMPHREVNYRTGTSTQVVVQVMRQNEAVKLVSKPQPGLFLKQTF